MIKRILKIIVTIFCFLLLGLASITMPIFAIYVLIKYILTGKEDVDLIFVAVDWALNIPIDFIDDIW